MRARKSSGSSGGEQKAPSYPAFSTSRASSVWGSPLGIMNP